jgi:RES domain
MVRAPDLVKDRLIVPLDRLVRLVKGVIVHRIHPSTYSPVGGVILFNDSDHGDARFSPLRDMTSTVIPTIYAGTTTDCSLMESVFHDVPLGVGPTNLDPARLDSLVRSEIQVIEELLLIDLTSVGLRFFGLKNTQLIDTDAADYKLTRSWAEVLYDRNPEAQGLYWTSRQDNRAQALMLFGTRTDSARYLRLIDLPKRLRTDDGTIDLDVLRLAKKIDVDLVR